ncbi:PPK2 family polyphosphate kinase [Bdellovibrio sp. BCCA]|uniref:PPK2 family polyphosphate kinase n=1 Tax=Bdellovibrio sp. BCCA TaxID=3136281 RepID=UPI0030F0E419
MSKNSKKIKEELFFPKDKDLKDCSTDASKYFSGDKDDLEKEIDKLTDKLSDLQELIFAESNHKILIILQGLDTSGKDGTVKHVFSSTNPQGVRVVSFKPPTEIEKAHDYLWRIHKESPKRGEIAIFNRSHYEDFIVPYVHHFLPPHKLKQRLKDIVNFEKMLSTEGVIIFKFFLHISPTEQAKRILERIDNPAKHWKFSMSDLREREHWKRYIKAYNIALKKSHHPDAPWNIIPADDKRLRDFLISSILVERLSNLNPRPARMDPAIIRKVQREAKLLLKK